LRSLWLAVAGITAYEIAPASVFTLVAGDLGVGSTGVSWLVSGFVLGMALFSIPGGIVLDRVDNRAVVVAGGAMFLLSAIWAALAAEAGAYPSLLAARFVAGVVNAVVWTACVNVVGATFPADRQGTGIGFLTTSVPGGFAIAHVVAPRLAASIGWVWGFVAFGAWTAILAAGFWLYTRGFGIRSDLPTPTRGEFARVLRDRAVWAIAGLAFAAFSLNLFFNNWLPTYLVDWFGLSPGVRRTSPADRARLVSRHRAAGGADRRRPHGRGPAGRARGRRVRHADGAGPAFALRPRTGHRERRRHGAVGRQHGRVRGRVPRPDSDRDAHRADGRLRRGV